MISSSTTTSDPERLQPLLTRWVVVGSVSNRWIISRILPRCDCKKSSIESRVGFPRGWIGSEVGALYIWNSRPTISNISNASSQHAPRRSFTESMSIWHAMHFSVFGSRDEHGKRMNTTGLSHSQSKRSSSENSSI